jgi:hypothetical protein
MNGELAREIRIFVSATPAANALDHSPLAAHFSCLTSTVKRCSVLSAADERGDQNTLAGANHIRPLAGQITGKDGQVANNECKTHVSTQTSARYEDCVLPKSIYTLANDDSRAVDFFPSSCPRFIVLDRHVTNSITNHTRPQQITSLRESFANRSFPPPPAAPRVSSSPPNNTTTTNHNLNTMELTLCAI